MYIFILSFIPASLFICQNYICLFLFMIPLYCPIYSMPNIIYFLTEFSHWSKLFSGVWSCTLNVILILKWPYFIHLFFFDLYILFVCLFISISWVWNQGSSFQLTHLVSCMRTGQSIIPLWGSNTQLCIVVVCPSEIELSFLSRRFPDLFTHLCYGLDSVDLVLVLELIPCFCPMHIETQANLHNSVNIIRKSLITGIVGSTLESDLERD